MIDVKKDIQDSLDRFHLKTDKDRIVSPGKFEGLKYYVPYYFEISFDNWDNVITVDGDDYYVLNIADNERAVIADILPEHIAVIVTENEFGFIYGQFVTENDLIALKTQSAIEENQNNG